MIIANGTIELAKKIAEGVSDDGYLTVSSIEWDRRIPCQYYPNNYNNLDKSNGEHFINAEYTILVEQQKIVPEQLRLKDTEGNIIGEFSIISVTQLDAVCETKILV